MTINIPSPVQHRNIVEAELVASIGWLIRIRWIAGVCVLLATWGIETIFGLRAPYTALYLTGAGILLYNAIFYIQNRRLVDRDASAPVYMQLAKWQVGMDWVAMILLIHFSGGIESPVIMFFFFHIIIASIFFPPRTAYTFALLAIGLLSATASAGIYRRAAARIDKRAARYPALPE